MAHPSGAGIYTGELRPFDKDYSTISLSPSTLQCRSCGNPCHELLTVPRSQIGRGTRGSYRIVRCLDCLFQGPYFVFFENGEPVRVVTSGSERRGFIRDQCEAGSLASMEWIPFTGERDQLNGFSTFAGGVPAWQQSPQPPKCPLCMRDMEFILQLSSSSIDTTARPALPPSTFLIQIEYYATLYFFYCERCAASCSITQCD